MAEEKKSLAQTEREHDIIELRNKVAALRREESVKREAADLYVDECKRAGHNPITGTKDSDTEAFLKIDKAYKAADELGHTAKELEHRLERLVVTTGQEAYAKANGDMENPAVQKSLSLAANFMASEDYRALVRSGNLDMAGAPVKTAAVPVATREAVVAALFGNVHTAAIDIDALIPTDRRFFPPVEMPSRQLRVRDLVSVQTTDTDTIEWVEETVRTDAVVETPYGTDAPESTYEYDPRTTPVKRLPHYVKAMKGNLADAGQLRNLLDNRLVYGVGKRLDSQMINGTGVGDNLTGILAAAGLQSVDGTGVSVADVFHMGLTAVRLSSEDEPDAFLLHPTLYEEFVLSKGTDGHYLNRQGPQSSTPPNVWGKNAVVNTVIADTSALVGNWKQGATLYLRSGIQVAATDSDATDFRKGIITILAEMRAAFVTEQVRMFAEIENIGA